MPDAFVDTNILVYAAEEASPLSRKGKIARELLRQPGLAISVQVLNEFVANSRHPRKLGLDPSAERDWLAQWLRLEVASLTPATFLLALRLHVTHQTSHWDSLILASALEQGCSVLYTEDLNHGQNYGGITTLNPFL